MASFLDNSSDIILDAVLTDYGRQLLAKGDGSFNIVKFAFGDDEIDYGLWNPDAEDSSLKDEDILTTPVMEAFTNNAASLKSKLLTIAIENLLYLPVLKLSPNAAGSVKETDFNSEFTGFVAPVEQADETTDLLKSVSEGNGLLNYGNRKFVIDQGLDSPDLDSSKSLLDTNQELYEREFNIIIDNRLGEIAADNGTRSLTPNSIDDDNMATYKVSEVISSAFVSAISVADATTAASSISGWKGSRLSFTVKPKQNLVGGNNALFDRLGNTLQLDGTNDFKTIRTTVKVVGVTTGYMIEIPILFAKYSA